jgi:hypothetical protein
MDEETIQRMNEYVKKGAGSRCGIIDLLCVDFRVKHGAILKDEGSYIEEIAEDHEFSYEVRQRENENVWYIASHPERLFLVRDSYLTDEQREYCHGTFCDYDQDSVFARCVGEVLGVEQTIEMCVTEFEEFLVTHDIYRPYDPCPVSFPRFLKRAYRRYEIAMLYEELFDFGFEGFSGEFSSGYIDFEEVPL